MATPVHDLIRGSLARPDHPDESQTLCFKCFWNNLRPIFYDTLLDKCLKNWMVTIYAQYPRVLPKCVRYVGRHLKSLFIWGDFQFHCKTWLVTGQWSDPVMRCYSMFIVPSKSCSWPLGSRFLTSLCLDDTTFISPGLDPLEWKEIGLFFLKYNSHTHFMLHIFSSARCSYSHNDPLSTSHFFKSRRSSMTAVYKGILARQALIQHI